jgi:hypothetical protein
VLLLIPVMWHGPDTLPATIKQSSIPRMARLGNGAPPVGADMSTMQFLRLVRDPAAVACAAVCGRRMCRAVWPSMPMLRAVEKEGLRMDVLEGWDISRL